MDDLLYEYHCPIFHSMSYFPLLIMNNWGNCKRRKWKWKRKWKRVVKITSYYNYSAIENGGNLWLAWAIGHNVKMHDLPNYKFPNPTHYVQVHLKSIALTFFSFDQVHRCRTVFLCNIDLFQLLSSVIS